MANVDLYPALINKLDVAMKHKEKGGVLQSDVNDIYMAARDLFTHTDRVEPKKLEEIRDKWVALNGEEIINKNKAMDKLKSGGSAPADAMKAFLMRIVKK